MRIVRSLSAVLLLCGTLAAQSRLEDYALILRDPPVARKAASRQGLRMAVATDHAARVRAAQRRVVSEISRRGIPVTGSARVLVNAVFVRAPRGSAAELQTIPGVARAQYLPPMHRKLDRAVNLV